MQGGRGGAGLIDRVRIVELFAEGRRIATTEGNRLTRECREQDPDLEFARQLDRQCR